MQFFIATVKRAGFGLVLLVAVLALNFVLMHIAPGDVADTIAQDAGGLDAEVMEQIRIDYGLDLPLWQQMAKYFLGRGPTRSWLLILLQRTRYQTYIREITSHAFVSDQCSGSFDIFGCNPWGYGGS